MEDHLTHAPGFGGFTPSVLGDGSLRLTGHETGGNYHLGAKAEIEINLGAGDSVTLRSPTSGSMLEMSFAPGNHAPARLRFMDGATLEAGAGSLARADLYSDSTYCITVRGNVKGANADGENVPLGPLYAPQMGGPLPPVIAGGSTNRLTRAGPIMPIILGGDAATNYTVTVGGEKRVIAPGKPEVFRTATGGEVTFEANPARRTLDWHVAKGVFRVTAAPFRYWRALALTGQQAGVQWNEAQEIIEVHNGGMGLGDTFGSELLVNLSPRINVAVAAGGSFSYGQMQDNRTFTTAAAVSPVTLLNAETGRTFRLDEQNYVFIAGLPEPLGGPFGGSPGAATYLSWNPVDGVSVRSSAGTEKIALGGSKNFMAGAGQELQISYLSTNGVHLKAVGQPSTVVPQFIGSLRLAFAEGAGAGMAYDAAQGVLTVAADAQNEFPIGVETSGYTPEIAPGSKLTFVIDRAPLLAATTQKDMIFYEAAGAGDARSFGLAPIRREPPTGRGTPTPLPDASRIVQPPVSTF